MEAATATLQPSPNAESPFPQVKAGEPPQRIPDTNAAHPDAQISKERQTEINHTTRFLIDIALSCACLFVMY